MTPISGIPNVRFGQTFAELFGQTIRFGTYQKRVRFGRTLTLKFGQTELNQAFDFLTKSVQNIFFLLTFLEIHACI